jgi:hypothetical protein
LIKINTKHIFNGFIAKQLLKKGNVIVDLQKNHNLKNASVFIFENTDKLNKDLTDITVKIK